MAILNGQTFFQFDPTEDVVTDRQKISSGLWSGDAGTLLSAFLNGPQSSSTGNYYLDVLNVPSYSIAPVSEVQFSIAYGHNEGSGSPILNQQYPTEAIYGQYQNILLDPSDVTFLINSQVKNHIMVVNLANARFRQSLDPGNWQLSLSGSLGRTTTLIDDSGQTLSPNVGRSGRVFNIVSGTIASGISGSGAIYGLVYPDMGIMIFDPDTLANTAQVVCNNSGSNVLTGNKSIFYNAIVGAFSASNGFIARREEEISSTHYFVRVKSAALNFSNNPTFTTGSLGDLTWSIMLKNPTVYPTTIGLYDVSNNLLAVAKLSQPVKKTFTNEMLVRVKLDF